MLIAAAVGGGAVLFLVIVFFATRDPAPVVPPDPSAGKKKQAAPDPHQAKRDEAMIWFQEELLDRPDRAFLSGERVEELLATARERGYHTIPGMDGEAWTRKVYADLLKREPNHPEANRAFGRVPVTDYPDFREVFRRLRHWVALPPEFSRLREKLLARTHTRPRTMYPAFEPEEYERVARALDRFREWDESMRADPTARAIHKALARVRTDPILGQYEFVHIELHPWVLFYASRKLVPNDDGAKEEERVAAERRRLTKRLEAFRPFVDAYLKFFRARWMKPLGLKDFEKDDLFFVWVFGERKSWEEYGRQTGTPIAPGILGYFDPNDHWVFLYEDAADRVRVESSLAHELTHQLHWHFSHEKDESRDFHNHFHRIKAVWFTEGWAEYAGWTERGNGGYEFGVPSKVRVNSLRALRKHDIPLFPVRDLVRRESYREWVFHLLREWLPRQQAKVDKPEVLYSVVMEMLYAQSWLLVRFLYEFEDGKYRDKALEFTKASLEGYVGRRGARGYAQAHEVFEEIFSLHTKADWTRFQREYEKYLTAMFYAVGK